MVFTISGLPLEVLDWLLRYFISDNGYGVIVNQQIIDWQPQQPAPPSGTARRVEITLYPEEPLNPRAGITLFLHHDFRPKTCYFRDFYRLTCQLLTSLLANVGTRGHRLRRPKGLPVAPQLGAARIQRARLVEISEPYRPQQNRPPVDSASSATIKKLAEDRSLLCRAQRANQPFEWELGKVERYQRKLDQLQTLHRLEQEVGLKLPATKTLEEQPLEEGKPSEVIALRIDKTDDLPLIPSPLPPEWAELPAQDFANHELWAQIGQLKTKFKITSERSFPRTITHLKSLGLRTLPAQQDARIKLFYRPAEERLSKIIQKPHFGATSPTPADQPSTITHNQFTAIWQAIKELQAQQQTLREALAQLNQARGQPQSA